jgi:hypothetical protein
MSFDIEDEIFRSVMVVSGIFLRFPFSRTVVFRQFSSTLNSSANSDNFRPPDAITLFLAVLKTYFLEHITKISVLQKSSCLPKNKRLSDIYFHLIYTRERKKSLMLNILFHVILNKFFF